MNIETLDILLNNYWKSPIEDAIGVTVKQIETTYDNKNNYYTIYVRMTHPLLPQKHLYDRIILMDKEIQKTQNDPGLLVNLLDKSFKIMTETTRKYILTEIDEMLKGR